METKMDGNGNECEHSMERAVLTVPFLNQQRIALENEIEDLKNRAKRELDENGCLSLQTENEIYRRQIAMFRALGEISDGRYGICKRCGKPIEIKRLIMIPEAFICCACIQEQNKTKFKKR